MKRLIPFYFCVCLISCSGRRNIVGAYEESNTCGTDGITHFILKQDSTFEYKFTFPPGRITGNWNRNSNKLFLYELKYFDGDDNDDFLDLTSKPRNNLDTLSIKGNKLYWKTGLQLQDRTCFLYKKNKLK